MAFTTVANNRFFEVQAVPALKMLDADPAIGPLSFAMLVPARYADGYQSLVLASEKLDPLGRREAISAVMQALERAGNPLDRGLVETISVLRTKSKEIRLLSDAFSIDALGTAYRGSGLAVDALDLEDPILFLSRPLPKAA